MSPKLSNYYENVNVIFRTGVLVLNVSRSLKTISMDLKLLAINGIVQAAKIGSKQGQSLIALSAFLSDLPVTIAPELEDLEHLANDLSKKIISTSIDIRKFMSYSNILHKTFIDEGNHSTLLTEMLTTSELINFKREKMLRSSEKNNLGNLEIMIQSNIVLMENINAYLVDAQVLVRRLMNKIDRIRRNGFIANYMGSNISIESSYLHGSKNTFNSLVTNIRDIVNMLNNNLESIMDMLTQGESILNSLHKSGILK